MPEPIRFEVAREIPGHLKVLLYFNTWDPQHIRSHVLKTEYGSEAPYIEDISVLVPVSQAYNRLSAYQDIFEALRKAGVLHERDKLKSFAIRDEDTTTLAYHEQRA